MTEFEPSQTFHDAAAYLSNAPSLSSLSNNAKLELYALFKTVTVDPTPNTSRPSIFDFTGRAKWDAWKDIGAKYKNGRQAAEERYVEIAKGLGWTPGAPAPAPASEVENKGEDDIWDDEGEGKVQKKSGDGMGNFVSTIKDAEGSEREETTIHALAIAGNEKGLRILLDGNQGVNVNQRDEFGYTPLHLACDRGHAEVAKLLLSRGADTTIKDSDEYTALELAEIAEHDDIVSLMKAASPPA